MALVPPPATSIILGRNICTSCVRNIARATGAHKKPSEHVLNHAGSLSRASDRPPPRRCGQAAWAAAGRPHICYRAHSKVAAAASCLCLSSGYDGANMVQPLAWPTQPLGFPALPQRAGRCSPWTPGKKQMNNPFYYSLTRRSRAQILSTRARNNDTWDQRRIVNNMR